MTPSNPDNQQPLIYRIADSLGVFHIVAPVNHTHAQSEVEGLVAALAAKAAKVSGATNNNLAALDANGDLKDSGHGVTDSVSYGSSSLITSGGVHAALQGKADKNKISETAENGAYAMVEAETTDKGQVTIGLKDAGDSSTDYTSLTKANIGNLKRALLNPDSTPTTNSDKLVTSGGVKAELESKANKVDVMYSVFEMSDADENIKLDNIFSDGHETSHFVLINRMGEQIKVSDFFYTQYGELVENGQTLSADSTAIVKIIHYNDGSTHKFFMVVEEIYEA